MPSKRYILTKKPTEYLTQGYRYCGGFTIKAVLSAYGLDDKDHPKEYLPFLGRMLGGTFEKSMQKILQKCGVAAPIRHARDMPDEEKLELLKSHLSTNNPIVMAISNGYNPAGEYSKLRSLLTGHWISLWGFDDEKKEFYAYDSYRNPEHWDDVPIGNVRFSYEHLLRDWKAPFKAKWRDFLWIPMKKNAGHR